MSKCCKVGEFECYTMVLNPLDRNRPLSIDRCMVPEIYSLWNRGIETIGCCCGHFQIDGFIQVKDEYVDKMKELGYEKLPLIKDIYGSLMRPNAFKPKTNFGKFEGYISDELPKSLEPKIVECRSCKSFKTKLQDNDNIAKHYCKALDMEVSPIFFCGFAKEV